MIKVLDYTKLPLTQMGTVASTCWGSKPSKQIGIKCIESGHGRVTEFSDVTVEIDGYSARVIRELYTHIIGTSRLQSSTRYINYGEFGYYIPPTIESNEEAKMRYDEIMLQISNTYKQLEDLGIPKQDIANILPLGSTSKIVLKINVRALLHLANTRLCNRALLEFRQLVRELLDVISQLDDDWRYIVEEYCHPICRVKGFCIEEHCCGLMPRKEDVIGLDK